MPWLTVDNSKEIYCLKWESKYLMELGESLEYLLNKVMTIAAKEALKYTVLAGMCLRCCVLIVLVGKSVKTKAHDGVL